MERYEVLFFIQPETLVKLYSSVPSVYSHIFLLLYFKQHNCLHTIHSKAVVSVLIEYFKHIIINSSLSISFKVTYRVYITDNRKHRKRPPSSHVVITKASDLIIHSFILSSSYENYKLCSATCPWEF